MNWRCWAGGVVTAIQLLASAIARIETELAGNPGMAGELSVLIASSCSQLGDRALGARALNTALPRCEQAFGAGYPLTLHARVLLLKAHNQAGDYAAAHGAFAGTAVDPVDTAAFTLRLALYLKPTRRLDDIDAELV